MSTYFIVHINMNDEIVYQKYLDESDEIFKKYNGEYLAVDDKYDVIEGKSNYTKIVIISFEREEDFNKWYYSNDYQRILKYRLSGAECDSVLVHGKPKG
jgi:uncharacterized protein (DUF1330 family)